MYKCCIHIVCRHKHVVCVCIHTFIHTYICIYVYINTVYMYCIHTCMHNTPNIRFKNGGVDASAMIIYIFIHKHIQTQTHTHTYSIEKRLCLSDAPSSIHHTPYTLIRDKPWARVEEPCSDTYDLASARSHIFLLFFCTFFGFYWLPARLPAHARCTVKCPGYMPCSPRPWPWHMA